MTPSLNRKPYTSSERFAFEHMSVASSQPFATMVSSCSQMTSMASAAISPSSQQTTEK